MVKVCSSFFLLCQKIAFSISGENSTDFKLNVKFTNIIDPRIDVLPSIVNPTNPQHPAQQYSGNGKTKVPAARPPRGLYLKLEELVTLASLSRNPEAPSDPVDVARAELVAATSKLDQQRTECQNYKKQLAQGIVPFRQLLPAKKSVTKTDDWTRQDTMAAVTGFREYGSNFTLIAEFIGTKSEKHVKHFYQTYNTRYNLNQLIAEHEAEKRGLNMYKPTEADCLKRKRQAHQPSTQAFQV